MSKVVRRYWTSDGGGLTRRDRRGCEYDAYLPDPLVGRAFTFDGPVAADIADAEGAIARLDSEASSLADTEAIARLLLRAEAVASSKIEGLEVDARRLLRVEAARELGLPARRDVTAEEVLGSVDAMAEALALADSAEPITVETILAIHRRLLAGTRPAEHAGRVRDVQNWIGGSAFNPCAAAFVPPPPEEVPTLLADLAEFCNGDDLPAVAQAAIAHAQFETIHPFADGNGRTGRALIQVVLRRRGLATRVVPPVSLVLATIAADYVGGLTAFRHVGEAGDEQASRGVNEWVALFAGACSRATADASTFEARVRAIRAAWRERVGKVRRGSAGDLLIDALPGCPIVTATSAAKLISRSFPATNDALKSLAAAGIVHQTSVGRRNRAFEAAEAIDAFTELERRLASPVGDTRQAPPARPVPKRRG